MTDISLPPVDLALVDRAGLPSSIAYLRETYPTAEWQTHINYGQLSAFWLHVHATLRKYGRDLTRISDDFRTGALDARALPAAYAPRFNQFIQHLAGHHQIEDSAYFPKFRALDPRMVAGFDLLEGDHHVIHEALLASVASARAMLPALLQPGDTPRYAVDAHATDLSRLIGLLDRHLADEEELVIPAILEHGERSIG